MSIWLPERMYHAVPAVCVVLGVVFLIMIQGRPGKALSLALISYGAMVLAARATYRSGAASM